MEKHYKIPLIFWMGLSVFVMFLSWRLGLEDKSMEGAYTPGPGLMPFGTSLLLFLAALYIFLRPGTAKKELNGSRQKPSGRIDLRKMVLVASSLFAYAFLLEYLGYLLTTGLTMILLLRVMGSGWKKTIATSLAATLITYFVFTHLGLLFPEGLWKLPGALK